MFKEQEHVEARNLIIPFEKISKFYNFMGFERKQYKFLEYRECLEVKPKTVYGAYSAQSLIKLIRAIQSNQSQFLQMLAVTTNLSKQNKKQFVIDKILRQYSLFSFEDILKELHFIREQLKDKDLYRQMIDFVKVILTKVKFLLYKYCETLVMVLGQCLNFYIRRVERENGQKQFSVVIGMDNICISFCSSNEFCENIIHNLVKRLRQHCMLDGFDIDEKDFLSENIQNSSSNFISSSLVPQYFGQTFQRKQNQLEQTIHSQENTEVFCTNLVINLLIKYAQDIFYLIQSTIVFLANLVLEKKQLKNITFDQQYISMKHPLRQNDVIGETFMNLYCEHFQGLPQQIYKNGQKCPYCSQLIIVDQVKCYQRNRNIFQNLLSNNYLNPLAENVLYYFKQKVFSLATKDRFSNYAHFCQFIKKHNFVRDRPQVLMLLDSQKVSLYSKLWGKKRLFTANQLIQTPVRGKYCRHLQFYQLMRVYQKYITKQPHQTSFQCFLCLQPVQYNQIMYLHQIKLLIELAKMNFYTSSQCIMNSYVEIDHINQTVDLSCQLEKGYMKRTYKLEIYNTLMDPLTKSQKQNPEKRNKKKDQESQFQYFEEFSNFYFGY